MAAPIILGIAAFVGIGSMAEGVRFPPEALTGMVAGVVDVAAMPTTAAAPDSTAPTAPAPTSGSPAASPVASAPAARNVTPFPFPMLEDPTDALPAAPPPIASLTGYRLPLARARLTLPFGPTPWGSRIVDGQRFHDGVDLATRCGDRIVAAHDGTVLAAGRRYDDEIGWLGDLTAYYARLDAKRLWPTLPIVVIVDDGNGYRSVYAHFERIVVAVGQTVRAGTLLGYEGRTGRASGCHLHYSLFSPLERSTFAIDPTVVKRMKLPTLEIARVDPMLVLPPLPPKPPKAAPSATPAPAISGAGSAAR